MKELNLIDFQYIYYKYKLVIENGRLSYVSAYGRDVTKLYYPLREIEGFTQKGKIDTVICFDSVENERKQKDSQYKSDRKKILNYQDIENINSLRDMLSLMGYCVLKEEGKEADDLIAYALNKLKDEYDSINIYTVDFDLLQLVQPKVKVHLYRMRHSYTIVDMHNFQEVATELFKTYIDYNMIMVYKSLVGDTSDNIKGIQGFGITAYKKWFDKNRETIACEYCNQREYVEQLIMNNFEGERLEQALDALDKVAFHIDDIDCEIVFNQTQERRERVYLEYEMRGLI